MVGESARPRQLTTRYLTNAFGLAGVGLEGLREKKERGVKPPNRRL